MIDEKMQFFGLDFDARSASPLARCAVASSQAVRHGYVRGCEIGQPGLKVQKPLQPSPAISGLVGSVRPLPGRIFEDRALDHRGHRCACDTLTDQ